MGRRPILEHVENGLAVTGYDEASLIVRLMGFTTVVVVAVAVAMTMAVVVAAAEKPSAGDVDRKTKTSDRDGLGKVDRHGREEARDGLVTDQQGDHRQDN